MHLAVYLALLLPALVVAAPRVPGAVFLADHLRPSTAARLVTAAGVGLATSSTLALGLLVTAGFAGWTPAPAGTGGGKQPVALVTKTPNRRILFYGRVAG